MTGESSNGVLMNDQSNDEVTRRRFLQGAAAVGVGSVATGLAGEAGPAAPKFPTHLLGRTKLRVSRIGIGGRSKRVLKLAVEAGINLVHSSTQYERGRAIRALGATFAKNPGLRDKLVLCLKGKLKDLEGELDHMLRCLHTDHADVYLPMLVKPDERRLEHLMTVQDALQKKGKIRFKGFVCHSSLSDVFEMILAKAPGYFDAALVATRMLIAAKYGKGGEVGRYVKNLAKLKAQGLGVISMKSRSGQAMAQGAKVFQAHCKTVLAGGADTVLFTFANVQQVHTVKGLDLSTTAMSDTERHLADAFHRSNGKACLMCGRCTQSCPRGLPVGDLMRIRMYHDEYGDVEYAQETYRELDGDPARMAAACESCTACSNACPIGLAGAQTVRYVTSLFA